MALVLITYAPSREVYDAVDQAAGERAPTGCIVHTASELDDGRVRVVDVWESKELIQEFFQTTLGPAFAKLGVEPEQPEITETFVQRP